MTAPKHETDEQLMLRVQQGERPALSQLMRRHANAVLTFLHRMCGDRHRSEELFQEVFLSVWKGRRSYGYPRPFRRWLFGIAANQCRSEYRARPIPAASLDALSPALSASPGPVDAVMTRETAALVQDAVLRLPNQQRAVAALRIWNECSYREIAGMLGTTESNARSMMCHALASLRNYLEPRLR